MYWLSQGDKFLPDLLYLGGFERIKDKVADKCANLQPFGFGKISEGRPLIVSHDDGHLGFVRENKGSSHRL